MKKSNPINVSGTKFENEVEDVLEKSGHPFRKTNKCDYELITDKGLKGVEVKAQKQAGSVDEKLVGSVYKYTYTGRYKELVFVLHRNFKFSSELILNGMKHQAKTFNTKLTILYGLKDLRNYLGEVPPKQGIFAFCKEEK